MFFGKLVKNIFITLGVLVLCINIYLWSVAIQTGTQTPNIEYFGFYKFFSNFERMPTFNNFVNTIMHLTTLFSDMSGWELALSILTLGTYFIAKFTWYIMQIILALGIDLIRWFIWIFGFFGIQVDVSNINIF